MMFRFGDDDNSVVDFYSDTYKKGILVLMPWYYPWQLWHKFLCKITAVSCIFFFINIIRVCPLDSGTNRIRKDILLSSETK